MPLALACFSPELRTLLTPDRALRTLGILALSTTVTVLLFSVSVYPLLFLLYPTVLYVRFQAVVQRLFDLDLPGFDHRGVLHGARLRPFAHWPLTVALARESGLQIFLGFHAVALLPLSLAILERRTIASQLVEANAQLMTLAEKDALTGIPNRRAFDQAFAREWALAARNQLSLSVIMIDVDHFKLFNDRYGHIAGDGCLTQVAGLLSPVVRRESDCVAPLCGEEFVALLPQTDLRPGPAVRRGFSHCDL